MLRPRKGMMSGPSMVLPPSDTLNVSTPSPVVPTTPTKTGQTKGMMTGGPVSVDSTPAPAPAPEPEAEMTFTFIEGSERGDARPGELYGQTAEPQQVTESELRDFFNDPKRTNRLPEVFGTFDNYLGYMTEREQLLQSGDLTLGDWGSAANITGPTETITLEDGTEVEIPAIDIGMSIGGGGELGIGGAGGAGGAYLGAEAEGNLQRAGYEDWLNSEVNQALLQKYGVQTTVYSETGDQFQWNGSSYVKVVDVEHADVGDFVKIGLAIAAGIATGGAASSALSSALGATGSAAVGAGLGSAVSQGIATGEIDIEKALIAAATAGITNEFSEFLGTYVEGSTQEQIKRLRDIQATVQPGGNAYQAAQQQIDLLTGALESADLVNQSGSIVNLVGDATEAYNQYRDIQENIDNFTEENEDAAWQTPDTTDILGDVQVQIRDYVSELEEQREESRESGEAGAQPAQPVEDIFADTTADQTGLEPESSVVEDLFSEYLPEPVQGPQGDPGRDGRDGVDGRDGIDGIDGVDGVDGRDGRDGVDGAPGERGEQGIQGIQGERGEQGIQGERGEQGLPGRDADPEAVRGIVESVVNDAISNIPPGTSTEEVREIVNSAIGSLDIPEGMTAEQVREIVGTAIGNIQFPASVTQEQVDEVVGSVRSDLETATTELGTSILGVQREVSEVERSLTEALEAATLGQETALSDAEANLLEQLTGVEADILQQMAESDAGLEAGLFDLGTNINQVRADLQSQIQTTQEQTAESLEQASEERRELQEALIAVGGDVSRLDEQTRQQFEQFGESVNELFTDVNVDIQGLREGQISQQEAFEQYQESATTQAAQATEDRRNLQQAIIGAQGDIEALDANTRQQFEEFGENVNELFSDVDVDIEALQEGQISQAEAQAAFEQSVSEQFGQVGEGLAGLGEGLEGLGQGVAGLGAGLGMGLLGLGQQQQQLAAQLAKPDPIPFDPFLKGLSPFQPLTPIALAPQKQTNAMDELNKFLGRQKGMLV